MFCPCHDELALLVESSIMEAVAIENWFIHGKNVDGFTGKRWQLKRLLKVPIAEVNLGGRWRCPMLAINDQGSKLLYVLLASSKLL